jgi:hypothetical protein
MTTHRISGLLGQGLLVAWTGLWGGMAAAGTSVEYYYAGFGHYFMTAFPEEAAALDAGAIPGWVRTGESFAVETEAGADLLPVCRFFSKTFAPKSSHFYTPFSFECEPLKQQGVWDYEGIAFQLAIPDANGSCPAGRIILYRLYNEGMTDAPNHRYTTRVDIFAAMRGLGWTPEGNGTTFAFACVPPTPLPPIATAEGLWASSTGEDGDFLAVFLENSEAWIAYGSGANVEGVAHGTLTSANGQLEGQLRNYDFSEDLIGTITLSGTYVPRTSIAGAVIGEEAGEFAGSYLAIYDQPAQALIAAGTWAGALNAGDLLTITVSGSGEITGGSTSGCQVGGTLRPRASGKNIYDLTVSFGGPTCSVGSGAGAGIAVVLASVTDPLTVLVMAESNDRDSALVWRGVKQ